MDESLAIGEWGHAGEFAKSFGEVALIEEADFRTDVCDGPVGFQK